MVNAATNVYKRSRMIWRQMTNAFSGDWVEKNGVRCDPYGELTPVAKMWGTLPDYSDIEIRTALAEIVISPPYKIPTLNEFISDLEKLRGKR